MYLDLYQIKNKLMENNTSLFETLVERAEQYGNTSIELYRLKVIEKSADVVSSLATKLAIIVFSIPGINKISS